MEPAAFPVIHPSFRFPLGDRKSLPERTRVVPGLSEDVALFPLQVQSFTPENLLFVSTLDGSLHALSKQTGDLKWTLKDGKEGLSLPGPQAGRGHLRIRAWGLESNTQVSSVSFTTYPGCVTLEKSLLLSEPQCPHL